VTPDASDEEAAWQELVAQYAVPAADGAPAPWPTREDLPGTAAGRGAADLGSDGPDTADLAAPDLEAPDLDDGGFDAPDLDADLEAADLDADRDTADSDETDHAAEPPTVPGASPVPGVVPAPPQLRIIRPASPAPLLPDDDDEHFVPPVPPPLPRLDPLTKGAWVALFGGPAYLLIAVMADWQVPGWAAFVAVAAFIGGFATLVVHMGERPPRDSGPDDGAVV
jgi:hypothetical protein